jgi:hypothetical protein
VRAVHAVAVALVNREGRLAVGGRPDRPQVARLAQHVGHQEAPDLRPPEEPGRHRGHLERGIGSQQPHQGGDVGILDRGGVLVDQRPLPPVSRLAHLVPHRVGLPQPRPGPLQHAVHRDGRGSE